jgi:hypothetical protein
VGRSGKLLSLVQRSGARGAPTSLVYVRYQTLPIVSKDVSGWINTKRMETAGGKKSE